MSAITVTEAEAVADLERLIDEALNGCDVVITQDGKPAVRFVAMEQPVVHPTGAV